MVDELLAFVFLPEKGVSLVQGSQKLGFTKQLSQMIGEQFFLERKSHERPSHADFSFDLS
jgi:hypothetical protein